MQAPSWPWNSGQGFHSLPDDRGGMGVHQASLHVFCGLRAKPMTVLPEIFEESEASAQTKCANLFRPEYEQ